MKFFLGATTDMLVINVGKFLFFYFYFFCDINPMIFAKPCSAFGCPYSLCNMAKESPIIDRLYVGSKSLSKDGKKSPIESPEIK